MIHERAISTILAHAADGGLPPSAIAWLRPRLVALDPPPLTRKGRLKYFARTTLDQTGRYTIAILPSFADVPAHVVADVIRHELLHVAAGDLAAPPDLDRANPRKLNLARDLRINTLLPTLCASLPVVDATREPWRSLAPCERPTWRQWYDVIPDPSSDDADDDDSEGDTPEGDDRGDGPGTCDQQGPEGGEYDRATEAVERYGARRAIADDATCKDKLLGLGPAVPPGDGSRPCAPLPPAPPDPAVRLAAVLFQALGTARLMRTRTWRRAHRYITDPILPGSGRTRRGRILVALDRSGSMEPETLTLARACAALERIADVEWCVHSDGPPSRPQRSRCGLRDPGTGGTRFGPLYQAPALAQYDLLVHVTDGECADAPPAPPVPLAVFLTQHGRWRLSWRPRLLAHLGGYP